MQRRKTEERKIFLDILEATMEKKNRNRIRKEEKKLQVRHCVMCSVISDSFQSCLSVRGEKAEGG